MSSERQEEFLSPDPRIPGQNYVCLSFVCPEEVVKRKETFFLQHFINDLLNNPERRLFLEKTAGKHLSYEETDDLYKGFLYNREEDLGREFDEANDFQTSVRGIKVRGTYDTEKEAHFRAKQLQKRDPAFNVWVGKVGEWLPFNADPAKMTNAEYNDEQLNTLMAKKREADQHRDEVFTEEVKRKMEAANRETEELKRKVAAEAAAAEAATVAADAASGAGGAASPAPKSAPADTAEKLNELKGIMDESDAVYDRLMAEQRAKKKAAETVSQAGPAGPAVGAATTSVQDSQALFGADDPWMSRRKAQAEKKDVSKDVNNLF